ncbi:hypothetical protein KP509_14G096600 [Ceratopteris richardii]|uniref:Uncharacterized protein n=1 Tax=Ceratopteris richardii TaxID=49495 RepID=A0A8T2TAJ6_CERRI|nr:hypothetical protein KP509_14G096600 [Ceratopteris richardii]
MGNHLSCVSPLPSNASKRLHDSSTSLSDPPPSQLFFFTVRSATFSELQGPLTAAEAMLEYPGQFLSLMPNLDSIYAGGSAPRVAALPADKELEPSQLYLLLHMDRLNSRFSLPEIHYFKTLKATQRASRAQTFNYPIPGSKVVPADDNYAAPTGQAFTELGFQFKSFHFNGFQDMNTAHDSDHVQKQPVQCLHLRKAKSWMPTLETVDEYGLQQ